MPYDTEWDRMKARVSTAVQLLVEESTSDSEEINQLIVKAKDHCKKGPPADSQDFTVRMADHNDVLNAVRRKRIALAISRKKESDQ